MMYNRNYYDPERFFSGRFNCFSPWHILILIGVIILVISVVKIMSDRRPKTDSKDHLRKLLKEKLINGQITEEEYRAKKRVIDED
ncbi:SHOCT domain-containing protein [Proteiniclasticum sp.]|uniref:SHOCT domain-containing protein n=1 Tax=Proteiniclasticum sp. TaxID=2053595 RepID=UPI0028A18BDF|nr:SHOCT domain-containing protein [Proteiniclasticum sp.]